MIAYLKGKVVNNGANFLVIDTGGIGYKVFTTSNAKKGETVELHCFHQVREDASDLYGFAKTEDLNIFEQLIQTSGVGPKMALNLVGGIGRAKIISAISKGDPAIFKTVSGVGNKVAMKIVVELKNKISDGDFDLMQEDDTIEALLALGLKRREILPYLQKIPENLTKTEDKVRFVLRNVGKKRWKFINLSIRQFINFWTQIEILYI